MTEPVVLVDYTNHKVSLVGGDPTQDKAFLDVLAAQKDLVSTAAGLPQSEHRDTEE